MTQEDFIKNGIPLIGFGPGMVGYNSKYKKPCKGLHRYVNSILRRIDERLARKKYEESVVSAIRLGYKLIDYSAAYGNGEIIGNAIQISGCPRESLFITTRVTNDAQCNHKVREEFMKCLHNMNLDYVDLLQFHWPVTGVYLDTWREMEKLKDEGFVKHLGVANCHQHHLEEIFKICKHRPEVGQFEIHPLFTQKPLIQYYKDNGIVVEAYTPIARYDDRLVRLPLLKRLEEKYNKTFVQIILRWHIQNGVIPLVRSMSSEHQKENFDIFYFELAAEDMAAIDAININSRLRYDPDNCDFSIL
jgi:diketogulonate reductase-like aldo/keto reductase